MSATESPTASPFVWYELHTTDVAAATAFYTKVLPWTIVDAGMPGTDYYVISAGAYGVGGLMITPAAAVVNPGRSGWLGYVGVKDIETVAGKLTHVGGTILKPVEMIPTVGSFAVVADPQGASFVLFEPMPSGEQTPPPDGTPGTFAWHDLTALDWQAAYDFYASLFAWGKGVGMDMGEFGIYQIFTINGRDQGGMMTRAQPDDPIGWLYYVNVADTAATVELVKANGGEVTMGPQVVPTGQVIAHFIDPLGGRFGVVAAPK